FFTSKARTLETLPGLHPGIVASATYWDAHISQAERLCIELLADAAAANQGCRAINYVRPEAAEEGAVALHDEVGGERVRVEPQIVVNAAGAWVDKANAALGIESRFMGGTKGSHLIVDCPDLHRALDGGMVYYQHSDGRVCIVFPVGDKLLMGSTDLRVDDPDEARCEEDEVEYMLTTLRGIFPGIDIRRDQIVYVFCGVRPLPASEGGPTATITRGHFIETLEPEGDRPWPVLCLIGGKWTTFRALAELAADRVLERLGRQRRRSTEAEPIGGGKGYPQDDAAKQRWVERVAEASGLDRQRVCTLLERYGTVAEAYAADADAEAETPLGTLPDHTVGEIRRIVEDEHVVHLDDLLIRRTTLALLGRATPEAIDELAGLLADALGWDEARRSDEARRAREAVAVPGR
ncbi:MAG: glycerol-3-phosphate dehydrogenase/oxidase, partial [Planctomycetota bacterium]